MTTRCSVLVVSVLAVTVIGTAPAAAQPSVAEVLDFLVVNQAVQTGSVERDQAAAEATSRTISWALLANLATLPVSPSSGGFVYRLNPELGTMERASESFGPLFIERALTAGAGTFTFGITFKHLRFTALDGYNLRDGSLVTTANHFVDEAAPFDVERLTLDIDASVATLYGNLGVTDRLEVGLLAPLTMLRLSGSRVNDYRGRSFAQAAASATALGLADVTARAKFVVARGGGGGLAAAADVRFPTGRSQDLLGAGALSTKVTAIASVEQGRIASHANVGVLVGGLAREVHAAAAVALTAAPRLSLTSEMLVRWMDTPGRMQALASAHPALAGVRTLRLTPGAGTLTMVTVAPGIKWNLTGAWVLTASVSLPLTTGGLTAPFVPLVGADRTRP